VIHGTVRIITRAGHAPSIQPRYRLGHHRNRSAPGTPQWRSGSIRGGTVPTASSSSVTSPLRPYPDYSGIRAPEEVADQSPVALSPQDHAIPIQRVYPLVTLQPKALTAQRDLPDRQNYARSAAS
jgi:hypothetical protein